MHSLGRRDASGHRGDTTATTGINSAIGFLGLLAVTIAAWASLIGEPRPLQVDALQRAGASWTCPMHPEVLEEESGTCPLCRMALVPFQLETVWSCPLHRVVEAESAGTCPVCRRQLVPTQMAVNWTCPGEVHIAALEQDTCADGRPMQQTRVLRPHGNHTPQFGGQFFMAPDNWHHLEGTYPVDGIFQLHVYDDYTRTLPSANLRLISGRVVAAETFDPATGRSHELSVFPLVVAADGSYLQADIGEAPLPRRLTAKLRFDTNGQEYRSIFTFVRLAGFPDSSPAPRPAPSRPLDAPLAEEAALTMRTAPVAIDILTQLTQLEDEIEATIDHGDFANVYRPAFTAKELALSLEEHRDRLPARQRAGAGEATASLVQAAWLLDAYGDLGNRQLLSDGLAQFSRALNDLRSRFGPLDQNATTSSELPVTAIDSPPGPVTAIETMSVPTSSTTGRASQ